MVTRAEDSVLVAREGGGGAPIPGPRFVPPLLRALPMIWFVIVIVVGVSVGTGSRSALLALAAIPAGAAGLGLVWLAATRFWMFLVALFAMRASLDVFRGGSSGLQSGLFVPSTLVGAFFVGSALAWVVVRGRAGELTRPSRTCRAFLVLSGVAMLSAAGAVSPLMSFEAAAKVFSSALMLLVLEQVFRDNPERIRVFLVAAFVAFVVPAIVGLAQFVGIMHLTTDPYDPVPLDRIRGTFSHPNVFATYLAMFLVFWIAMLPRVEARWRRYIAPACALAGALLLLTYSRAAWLAALVGLLAVAILQSHRLFWALIVGLFVVVVMVPSVTTRVSDLSGSTGASSTTADKNSVSWRFDYWKRILPEARQNPVTGLGLEMVAVTQPDHYAPHNVYIQAIVELGVVGFLAVLAVIAAIASDLRRAWRRARGRFEAGMVLGVTLVALGLLMQTFSENLLDEIENQWYFFLLLAWVIVVVASRPEPSTDTDTLPPPPRPPPASSAHKPAN